MVPKRLKEAREAAGFSQEKLAQLIEIESVNSRSRISNYEAGRYTPPFDFIVRVAKMLNYPESYFYTVDDDFAKTILALHQGRMNPEANPHYNSVIEVKKLTEQLDEARKLTSQLNECLKHR